MSSNIDGSQIGIELLNQQNYPNNETEQLDYADINKAVIHGKAQRVGTPLNENSNEICECCEEQVNKKYYSIFDKNSDLHFLGPGFPLYFGFAKACMVLLLVTSAIYTTYGMYTNHKGQYCFVPNSQKTLQPYQCYKNIPNQYSLINRMNNYQDLKHQNYVNLGVIVILIIFLHLYRIQTRKQENDLDDKFISLSDYTVQLSNLPKGCNQDKIQRDLNIWWSNNIFDHKQAPIKKIYIAYHNAGKLKNLFDELEDIKKQQRNKLNNHQQKELMKKIEKIKEQINEIKKKPKSTSQCFVSFDKRQDMEILVESQKKSFFKNIWIRIQKLFCMEIQEILLINNDNGDNNIISVERAPEPTDVNWENCGVSDGFRFCKRIFTFICTLLILSLNFLSVYFINKLQYKVNADNEGKENDQIVRAKLLSLSVFSTLSVQFINYVLNVILTKLTEMEQLSTATEFNQSMAEKLTLAQFVNTSLLTLAAYISIDPSSFWQDAGITNDISFILISNCVLPQLYKFLNPFYFRRLVMRRIVKSNVTNYSQDQANKWYQGGSFDLADKYSTSIECLWTVGFYTPLTPYLPCFGFIALLFNYIVDKYVVLNRIATPNQLGSSLNKSMIEMLEYFPFSLAIGNLVWMNKLNMDDRDSLILQIIGIVLSSTNFIIPSAKINEKIYKIEPSDTIMKSYDANLNLSGFKKSYDYYNPFTKDEKIIDLERKRSQMTDTYGYNNNIQKNNISTQSMLKSQIFKNQLSEISNPINDSCISESNKGYNPYKLQNQLSSQSNNIFQSSFQKQ